MKNGDDLVVVGLSGGLDSAVAAWLLLEAGYRVEGVFLSLWDPLAGRGSRCCSLEDLEDARRVAAHLGIPLHERCTSRRFFDEVFLTSLEIAAAGQTPNPCVRCNERIKFSELEALAAELGGGLVATGHYARVEVDGAGAVRLLCARDAAKDQSYFLHRLTGERLRRVRLPLGRHTKVEARALAAAAGLPVAAKGESQELCFVPAGSHLGDLVEAWLPQRTQPGAIVDRRGRELGRHHGVHRFTVGQRRGLGLAVPVPHYVLAMHPQSGKLTIGPKEELATERFRVDDLSWVAGAAPADALECTVKVRSRHDGAPARVVLDASGAEVHPHRPLRAPAPGQAAVFYDGDEVLGGGWISVPAA